MEALTTTTELTHVTEPILSTISALISAHTRTAGTQINCTMTATTGAIMRTRAIGRYGVVQSTRVKRSRSWRLTKIIFATNTPTMVAIHR